MTDGGAAFEPGRGEPPFRPRGAYVGHEVFGHGDGAVLVDPEVARDLRSAAESASQERRIAGGLLYGRMLADDKGKYLVIDGFLEAGPGETRGIAFPAKGATRSRSLTGPAAAARGRHPDVLGRTRGGLVADARGSRGVQPARLPDAARARRAWRRRPARIRVGTRVGHRLPGTGRAGPRLGQVIHPGRPARHRRAARADAGAWPGAWHRAEPDADLEPDSAHLGPEPAAATAPGTSRCHGGTGAGTSAAADGTAGDIAHPRAIAGVGVKPAYPSYVGPKTPTDVKIVVGALVVTAIVAATIIGVLVFECPGRRDRRRGEPARDLRLPLDVAAVGAVPR